MKLFFKQLLFFFLFIFPSISGEENFDIVIYGGTSSGVIAGVQAAKMGKSVAIIEPSYHIGGMTSNGLGWVDVGNVASIGGLTKDYFYRVWKYYQNDEAWKWESRRVLKNQNGFPNPHEQAMWILEPHVAEKIFEEMAADWKIPIIRHERLDRQNGIFKTGSQLTHILMESGRLIHGKMFIDASYEGDLMAAAGVSYAVGREHNDCYGETLNGVLPNVKRGNMPKNLDPYSITGDPKSGLLPRVFAELGGEEGKGDTGIQAYNYRMCLTDVLENQIRVAMPENYDEREYELVFRAVTAKVPRHQFFKLDLLPNRKTDSNNNGPVSTDYVGMSWNYVESSYSEREKIALEHKNWQLGLIWTLQNHPRMHQKVKDYYAPWGLPKDEFVDNDHWPYQLYIREGRRMVSSVVITEAIALGNSKHFDGVGLASYHMDSHAVKYFVAPDGFLMTDGCIYRKGNGPFSISYRAIIPKKEECENLLVPICLSSSHAAYGTLRMEPVFMILGQSAATAASLAIDLKMALQDLPYDLLKSRLLNDKQILESKVK